jgi:hypothetical protein
VTQELLKNKMQNTQRIENLKKNTSDVKKWKINFQASQGDGVEMKEKAIVQSMPSITLPNCVFQFVSKYRQRFGAT